MKKVLLIMLMCVFPAVGVHAAECTKMEAYAAESVTAYLDSWRNIGLAFQEFGHCDDGAIAEGFDESISVLWANQWDELNEMLKLTERDNGLKAFLYKRIASETVPLERWQTIAEKAETQCPNGAKEFCSAVVQSAPKND